MSTPTSTKPYLLRALYEWCVDNGFTPYLSVIVDGQTKVPMEHVRDGEIVLNIGPMAASRLNMGNQVIECSARFSGAVRELSVPIGAVAAIYARENGQGMSFETEGRSPSTSAGADSNEDAVSPSVSDSPDLPVPPKPGGKPVLRRVK